MSVEWNGTYPDPRGESRRARPFEEIASERGGKNELMTKLGLTLEEFNLAETKPYFWQLAHECLRLQSLQLETCWSQLEYYLIAGIQFEELELFASGQMIFSEWSD